MSGLASLAVIAPWILSSRAALTDPLLHYVTTGIHGDASRIEILVNGASVLVAGTTAFNSAMIDVSVFLAGFVLFSMGSRRSTQASVLGAAAVLGALVWMATANYDTRALMPFQMAAIVLSLAGLGVLLDRVRNHQLRHSIQLSLQVIFLLAYLLPQLAPNLRVGGAGMIDWKPGQAWARTIGLWNREDKLRILRPALADLEQWKRDHLYFSGTLWSDPVLIASFDPTATSGPWGWLGVIESEGEVNWKAGDFLLVTPAEDRAPKLPHPVIDRMVGLSSETWGPWIDAAVKSGVLQVEATYSTLRSFQFAVEPSGKTP